MKKNSIITPIFALAAIIGSLFALHSSPATAVSAGDWNASNIIDDAIFYSNTAMSTDEIQSFMNSKNPSCDTQGTRPASEYGRSDITHAQYAANVGWPGPPYVCLRDYYQVPRSDQNINNLSTNVRPEGSISAAEIIKRASDTYGINPKVLLVLIQKESVGPLLTDTWPIPAQYRSVVGYACPDTAPCDPKYAGFYNQIMNAAYQFKYYKDHAYDKNQYGAYVYRHQPYNTVSLLFNPNSSCGSTQTRMDNFATTGLYNYTPYQPNQAALNNMYGTGDGCSAYGNRNFWRMFTDWFGSTKTGQMSIGDSVVVSQSLSVSPSGSLNENQQYTASFTLKNNSGTKIDVGWMLASVRDSGNFNLDFPAKYVSIEPYGTYTYSASRTFQWTDNMRAFINGNLTQGIGWSTTYPKVADANIVKSTDFRVGSDVVLTNGGIKVERINQTSTYRATAVFYNRTNQDRNIGWYLVSGRNPFGENIDFPAENITVPANSYATYSQTRDLTTSDLGEYNFFSNLNDTSVGGYGWTTDYPMRNDIWSKKALSFTFGPAVIQSSPLTINTSQAGDTTATVSFKNQGNQSEYLGWVIVSTRRAGDGTNYDFQPQDLTLKPGESRTLTFRQSLLRPGAYTSSLLFNRPTGWTDTYAPSARTSIARQVGFNGSASVEQATPISVSGTTEKRTASFSLKNRSNSYQDLGWVIISVRDSQDRNYDFPGVYVKLAPNETRTVYTSRSVTPGSYSMTATANHSRYGWGVTFDTSNVIYPVQVNLP